MNREYRQAVDLLDEALRRLNAFTPPSQAELSRRQGEYSGVRSDHERMGARIDELGQARQSSIIQSSIDSLQAPQARSKTAIEQHMRFEDDFRRSSFFARSYEQVKEDVEYALARFTRFAGSTGVRDAVRDRAPDAGAIDDELERLRRELEALEQ
jgi:hypothetical protein